MAAVEAAFRLPAERGSAACQVRHRLPTNFCTKLIYIYIYIYIYDLLEGHKVRHHTYTHSIYIYINIYIYIVEDYLVEDYQVPSRSNCGCCC